MYQIFSKINAVIGIFESMVCKLIPWTKFIRKLCGTNEYC